MDKRYIQPQELRQWWDWVRPRLWKVKEKSPEPWIPEDVYADCFEARAMLWIGFEDNRPVIFVVLQPLGETLHVWCCWGENGYAEKAFTELLDIAKVGNAKRLTFDSHRPGWDKVARKFGFKPRKWAKELI